MGTHSHSLPPTGSANKLLQTPTLEGFGEGEGEGDEKGVGVGVGWEMEELQRIIPAVREPFL